MSKVERPSEVRNHPLTVQERLDALAKDLRWKRDQQMIEARSCDSGDKVTRSLRARNARRLNWLWVRQQALLRQGIES